MNNEIMIRDYQPTDKEAVLTLLALNTPASFAPEEKEDLIRFLDTELEYYFVVEREQRIAGCGGFNFSGNPDLAKISWDMVHPEFHSQGLGSQLLLHRLAKLTDFESKPLVIVRTTQMAHRFYQKHGFVLQEIVEDYWAKGFHLFHMEYAG